MTNSVTLRRVTIFLAFYLPVAGLIQSFLPIVLGGHEHFQSQAYRWIQLLFPPVYLKLLYFDYFVYVNEQISVGFDIVPVVFHLLTLLSAVLYVGAKESRLLQFCFSILLLCVAWNSVLVLTSLLRFTELYRGGFLIPAIMGLAVNLLLCFLLLGVLRKGFATPALSEVTISDDFESRASFVDASRWQRWGHSVIDAIINLLLFSPVLAWFVYLLGKFDLLPEDPGRTTLSLLFMAASLSYYLFFEGLLGYTPAKVLTGSRVTDEWGRRPHFRSILRRSFSRLVPFEALSFLGNRGWHDEWSATWVLQEKRKGWPVRLYFFVLPLLLLLSLGIYGGMNRYSDHRRELAQQERYEENRDMLSRRWQRLKPGGLLQLSPKNNYEFSGCFLRLEERRGDAAVFSKIFVKGDYGRSDLAGLKLGYLNEGHPRAIVPLSKMEQFTGHPYAAHKGGKGFDLFGDGQEYELADVLETSGPEVRGYGSGSMSSSGEEATVSMSFINHGDAAEILSVTSADQRLRWSFSTPQVEAARPGTAAYFYLTLEGYPSNSVYEAELRMRDASGKIFRFRIRGRNLNPVVERLD